MRPDGLGSARLGSAQPAAERVAACAVASRVVRPKKSSVGWRASSVPFVAVAGLCDATRDAPRPSETGHGRPTDRLACDESLLASGHRFRESASATECRRLACLAARAFHRCAAFLAFSSDHCDTSSAKSQQLANVLVVINRSNRTTLTISGVVSCGVTPTEKFERQSSKDYSCVIHDTIFTARQKKISAQK